VCGLVVCIGFCGRVGTLEVRLGEVGEMDEVVQRELLGAEAEEAGGAARRAGQEFDLRDFHDRALAVGSLPLDVLREVLAG